MELHGTFWVWRCTSCGDEREERTVPSRNTPPLPLRRYAPTRRVVWFGEALPEAVLTKAWQTAEGCGLFMSLGTSSVVELAASLCRIAADAGAKTVEINPQETPLSSWVDVSMRGTTGELLPEVTN